MKKCTVCGGVKPVDDFYANKRYKDGRKSECKVCTKVSVDKYKAANPELVKRRKKAWCELNREKKKATDAAWRADNADRVRQKAKEYKEINKEKIREQSREYARSNAEKFREHRERHRKKRSQTPKWKIDHAFSVGIRKGIRRGSKGGRKWCALVGYTTDELMAHLERLFHTGMTWDNYGPDGWHIDHIRPKASFNYNTPEDAEFRECWALSNLQPMWGRDNSSKGAKYPAANDNEQAAKAAA